MLGYDTRQYKQSEIEDPFEAMRIEAARQLETVSYEHNLKAITSISNTVSGWMNKVTELSITQNMTINEARQALINHLRAHALTIATTETEFIAESTRNIAIMLVNDPLKNSVIQVAELIRAGDTNAAVRLSRYVMKLVKQPLSLRQGTVIGYIKENLSKLPARPALMTPLVQGRIIANLEARAESLGKTKKQWSAIFHNTREAHKWAEGQERFISEPFDVGGEKLQYPGDASLGASIGNIIRCQCSALYI
jgi:hypothetical protein